MPVTVTFTWARINPNTPSAYDSAAADYEQSTGGKFADLSLSARCEYIRKYINR